MPNLFSGNRWRIVDDSEVDYNFIRAFYPNVTDGMWLGCIVTSTGPPADGLLTVNKPVGAGTYTAPVAHFEQVPGTLDHLIQVTDGCYYWMGPAPQRRPIIREGKKTKSARRVLWEEQVSSLTNSQIIVDTCNNPMCMRLDHLRVISRSQLVKDSLR